MFIRESAERGGISRLFLSSPSRANHRWSSVDVGQLRKLMICRRRTGRQRDSKFRIADASPRRRDQGRRRRTASPSGESIDIKIQTQCERVVTRRNRKRPRRIRASQQQSRTAARADLRRISVSLSEQALRRSANPDPNSGQVTMTGVGAADDDIIIMLRDKSGNLDAHEQAWKEILSGLQMKYVELARQPNR